MSGNLQDLSCGFMVNVRRLQNSRKFYTANCHHTLDQVAGSGKSVLWYMTVA